MIKETFIFDIGWLRNDGCKNESEIAVDSFQKEWERIIEEKKSFYVCPTLNISLDELRFQLSQMSLESENTRSNSKIVSDWTQI